MFELAEIRIKNELYTADEGNFHKGLITARLQVISGISGS